MGAMITRSSATIALFGLLTTLSAPVLSAQDVPLPDQLEEWFAKTRLKAPGTWGIVVSDQAGKFSGRSTRPAMIPASTVKVLTTGFARTTVGGDARQATRVLGEGGVDRPAESGKVAGRLN